jgi:prepilin-type N-terminal cleavage/methylation domain-containing protein
MRARQRSVRRGFTILEVVIVMSMMATVVAIVVPNMMTIRQQTAVTNAGYVFARDLNQARVEAGRRNTAICVTRTGTATYAIDGLATQTLPDGVTFSPEFETVCFASFGPVTMGAGAYELVLGSQRKGIRIEPAGFTYVQRE